jgi:acyl homoserine lactone synthase
MTRIAIGRAGEPDLNATLLDSMYRLRSEVFHERLGWEVRVEHGREHDWFDLIGPHYLIAHEQGTQALGCCRLLPTLGPNMLRDIFPSLLDGAPVPAGASIWEVSRFAISTRCAGDGFGFGDLPAAMLANMFHFAAARGVEELVGVTSAPIERMLRHLGLHVERLGNPQRIGRVLSLAFRMPVSDNLPVAGRISGSAPALDIARAA